MNTGNTPGDVGVALRRFALQRHQYVTRVAHSMKLSRMEFDALDYIQEAGKITPAALADLLCVTGGAVTSLVDKLEAAGYVKREANPRDRRSLFLSLTKRTQGFGAKVLGGYVRAIEAAAGHMTPDQRAAVIEFLRAATSAAATDDFIAKGKPKPSRRQS